MDDQTVQAQTLKRPSSTITAATLTGMGLTLLWEILAQAGFEARPALVAASVTFASALVGYLWPERVLQARIEQRLTQGQGNG